MKKDFCPLLVMPAVPHSGGVRFFHSKTQYDVRQYTDVIWSILAECNGRNPTGFISARVHKKFTNIEIKTIESIIADLVGLGVLADRGGADLSEAESVAVLSDLWRMLVGRNKPVRTAKITAVPKPQSGNTFFAAAAVFAPAPGNNARQPLNQRTAGGTATSASLALIKAISEAYERYASGLVRVDVTARASELTETWLDPRRLAPLTKEQYKKLPHLQPFNKETVWQWVRGFDVVTGKNVLVPIDLVFCPIRAENYGRKLCYEASSSGVAAFTDEKQAIQRGLSELIERDAIMRDWFRRESPPQVANDQLPEHWRNRTGYWQARNRKTFVLDLSEHGVVAVLVVIVSETAYPSFAHGAAASMTSFDEALAKAFQEAESGLLDALARPKTRRINQRDVTDPLDHAMLYNHPDNLENLRWLWSGNEVVPAPKATTTLVELVKKLRPVAVKLSPEVASLSVVRVLCETLIPINFGYGTEHFSHPSVRGEANPESLKLPHYFA